MTIRILSAGLAALLPMLAATEVGAQTGGDEGRPEPRLSSFHRERVREDPEISRRLRPHPLFVVELRTNVTVAGKCIYYVEDPCPFVEAEIVEFARNELLAESASLLRSMLEERGFEEKLKQSISDRLRRRLLDRLGDGRPPVETSTTGNDGGGVAVVHDPLVFPPPDTLRILTGTLLFAGGGVLSASDNEWPIDEGYIGVGIAVVGLGLVFKQLVPEWRGAKIRSSGTNLSVSW